MISKINHNTPFNQDAVDKNTISRRLGTLIAASVFSLSACTNDAKVANYPVLPEGLKDCKFYVLNSKSEIDITVGRCPNSTTSVTTHEKYKKTTITIDGDTY